MLPFGSKFFPFRVDPLKKGDKNNFDRIAYPVHSLLCFYSAFSELFNTTVLCVLFGYLFSVSPILIFSQLRDAFIYQLTQGYSHYDRQLRNDLLVLASLIAANCPDAPFVETGFAKQLTVFATFQEGNVSTGKHQICKSMCMVDLIILYLI